MLVIHGGPGPEYVELLQHFDELANDFTLIFYDQRGSGRSSFIVDSTTINHKDFVEDMGFSQMKLNFEKIDIIGYS